MERKEPKFEENSQRESILGVVDNFLKKSDLSLIYKNVINSSQEKENNNGGVITAFLEKYLTEEQKNLEIYKNGRFILFVNKIEKVVLNFLEKYLTEEHKTFLENNILFKNNIILECTKSFIFQFIDDFFLISKSNKSDLFRLIAYFDFEKVEYEREIIKSILIKIRSRLFLINKEHIKEELNKILKFSFKSIFLSPKTRLENLIEEEIENELTSDEWIFLHFKKNFYLKKYLMLLYTKPFFEYFLKNMQNLSEEETIKEIKSLDYKILLLFKKTFPNGNSFPFEDCNYFLRKE